MTFSYHATILYPKMDNKIDSIKQKCVNKKLLSDTLKVYQKAVSYIIYVIEEHYCELSELTGSYQINAVEKLIHNTKDNTAVYDFDKQFPQFPSYFRRDAINNAIGAVCSYQSRKTDYALRRYEAASNSKKFKEKESVLNYKPHAMPTFFKGNMYIPFQEDNEVQLKLYKNGKWEYFTFCLQKRDLKYILQFKDEFNGKLMNPVLEYSYGRFHLRYAVSFQNSFSKKKKVGDRKILSVDLGINNDAVCSVMYGDGTIVEREFISLSSEKAGLYTLLNRKKKLQRCSGNYKYAPLKKVTAKIKGMNDNLSNQVAHKIVNLARLHNVDVVVFENLSSFHGKKTEKIHYWRKKDIIHKCHTKLHAYGIRYATVNPKNTSAYAYDGSGRVFRDEDNFSMCTFRNGKRYPCDLSASYNIGVRYFIREYLKLEKVQKIAESMNLPSATHRTYFDFKNLVSAI